MSRLTSERLTELYTRTLELVVEHGYDKLTMDQVAEATRSSKATLYRQWGGKAALVVEALRCTSDHPTDLADTGTLRGDLLADVADHGSDDEAQSALIIAIMHATKQDPELAQTVESQIVDPGRERIRTMLQRAIDRGEVEADCPALRFADLLFISPFVVGALLDGRAPDRQHLADYYDAVLLPALGITTP